jgi:hypothetical protein
MASCATERLVDSRPRPRKVASASGMVRFMITFLRADGIAAVRWRTRTAGDTRNAGIIEMKEA